MQRHVVMLGQQCHEPTAVEVFPDPASLFHHWTPELAARILPLLSFDLALLKPAWKGRGTVLFYEDYRRDYLSWKVSRGKIRELKGWQDLRPFPEAPDTASYLAKGRFLNMQAYTVEIEPPESCPDWDWQDRYATALMALEGPSHQDRPRLGGYPCYVQNRSVAEREDCLLAEVPTAYFDLPPVYLYLHSENGKGFWQEMQMT